MLKVGDTFEVSIPKKFSENRVVSNSKRAIFVPVQNANNFHPVGEKRDAVSLKEL